jgi:hypothetical protein
MSPPPMEHNAPDVRLGVDLIDRIDLQRWDRIADDLLQPTPRIHHEDASHLDDLLAWMAAQMHEPRSYVDAAVMNAAGVLQDLLLVLHYEMDFRDNHYWVTQWYRRSYGRPVHQRRVEEFGVHVALVHNLVIELTRAWNLVIDRTRQADPDALSDARNALASTGPDHAPMQAVRYSDEEAADPQPYPGLAEFPAAVQKRRHIGLLGRTTADHDRTLAAFSGWIEHLVRERGPHSDSPGHEKLPFALPKPSGSSPDKRPPSPWRAVAGILTAASVIAGLLASFPWLIGATAGAALGAGLLHRRVWRVPPETIPTIAVIVTAASGAVVAEVIAGDGGDKPTAKRPKPIEAPRATSISLLHPFTGDRLNEDLRVEKTVDGTCFGFFKVGGRTRHGSQGSGSPEAARCFGDDHGVYDPCYVSQTGRKLACPGKPWNRSVVLVRSRRAVRSGVRKDVSLRKVQVFGFQLAGGQRCFFVQGAGQITIAGARVNYTCERGVVVGTPDRSGPVWSATYAPGGTSETHEADITRAWF